MIQRHVYVSGRVQGVGFRAFVHRMARNFSGLKGFVRNVDDGRVEAVFCGNDKDVLSLCEYCSKGPPSAQVTRLEVKEEPVDPELSHFTVLLD